MFPQLRNQRFRNWKTAISPPHQTSRLDWTHNLVLIKQVKVIRARYWYMVQSITSHWSKRYRQEAIKLDDYGKHGALANNFTETLPKDFRGSLPTIVRS